MVVNRILAVAGYGAGALAVLLLAINVDSSESGQFRHYGHNAEIILRIVGQLREVVGAAFVLKMDEYYHRGTRHPEGESHGIDDHTHTAGEHTHGEAATAALLPRWDVLTRLNRRIHDQPVQHLAGVEQQELLPWVAAAVIADPHQITAYVNGGFWLSDEMRRPQEALRFLEEGRRHNPQAWQIYAQMGQICFRHTGDYARARVYFQRALSLQPPQVAAIDQAEVLTFLAAVCEQLGDPAAALPYYEQLHLVVPQDPAPVRKIEALRAVVNQAGGVPR